MTLEEAISVIKTEIGQFIIDEKWKNALALAIEALKAQDSKTRRICDTCKHNPVSKKWPCVDCDMREPADRWERKDVPDTNVGDMISRQAAIDALNGLPTWWADSGGYYGVAQPPMTALLDPEDAISAIGNLPSVQPEIVRCKDCKRYGRDDGIETEKTDSCSQWTDSENTANETEK